MLTLKGQKHILWLGRCKRKKILMRYSELNPIHQSVDINGGKKKALSWMIFKWKLNQDFGFGKNY